LSAQTCMLRLCFRSIFLLQPIAEQQEAAQNIAGSDSSFSDAQTTEAILSRGQWQCDSFARRP